MSTLITLLMLLPAASLFQQLPAGMDQSKQDAPVSIKDLRSAPTEVVLDGRSAHLSMIGVQPAAAQASPSASQAANRFYRTYLKLKILGLPNSEQMKALTPLITADLNDLFESARKTQAKFIQDHPDEKPPWADGDLFTSLFEGAQSFRLGRPTANGDRVEVPVHLTYHQGGSTTRWSDVIILVRDKNRWLVWDILLKGEWAFKSGDSLRKNLSSN